MPSLCDSYSPTLQSPSFFVQRSDLLYVSNRESGCVCVFFFCLFHCLPVFSLHFLCALSSGVSQPFLIHFWDLQPILPHHPCTISIPPSSLSWFSLSSKLNCWLFTVRYKWSSHITAIWCFFDNLVQDFYLYLIFFYIIVQIIFSIPPLLLFFAVFFYHPLFLLLLLFSWHALPTDVAAYVALTGPKQRAACARSGWLQVTSVFINRQIPPSIWEHSTDWEGEGEGEGGRRKGDRQRQTEREFCVIYSHPWSRSCHLPCSVIATSLEGHWPCAPVPWIGFSN